VLPLHPNDDDDDLADEVQTTLGPYRLGRRLGGPSRGDSDQVERPPTASPVQQDEE
jgi:hypothetical protein